MKINSISTKPIFKAQFSPEIRKGMLSKVENIEFVYGKDSKQYKDYANNIRRCLDYSPEAKVYTKYSPKTYSYLFTVEKAGKKTYAGIAANKEDLFNADNVQSLACTLLLMEMTEKPCVENL